MAITRCVFIAVLVCVLVGHSASRDDRRECSPQSTDPQCLPAMEFNNFFNVPKKHRRFAPDSASSDFKQKNIKLNNWPSFHPPLKSTPSYLQTTTVAIVKQTKTAKQSSWPPHLLLPPPPITFKRNIPNKVRPNLKKKKRPPLLPTDNIVFNNLEQKGQKGAMKDSSTNLKSLQNTSFSLKVNEKRKIAKKPLSDKINQSSGGPALMVFEKNDLVKSEIAGTLETNKRQSKKEENKMLKKQITSTIRRQRVEVVAESTPAFPDQSLTSTFAMIRIPKRIRTSLQNSEETNIVENAEAFTLQTSTVSNVNTNPIKRKISQMMTTSTLHTTLSEIQDSETLSKMTTSMVLPVQAVETPVKLNKVTTTVFESQDLFTTTMSSVGNTQPEQPSTIDKIRQAISNVVSSTNTKNDTFRTVSSFRTESKILTMLSQTVSTKYTKVSTNQKMTMRTKPIFLLQTTVSSNKPNKSKSTLKHTGNFSEDDYAKNRKSDAINCDPLLAKRRHLFNRLLNASSRNSSFLTTTLSVKIKAPQEDWTISDNRASAVGIGSLGVVVIVAIIGGVICLDAATLYRDAKRIRKKIYRIFKPLKSNNKNTQVSKKMPKWAHFVTTRDA